MDRNRYSRGVGRVLVLFAVALTLAVPACAEWNEKVLYSFQGGPNDGAFPVGGVVFDVQGNLYGVLQDYGPASCAPIGNECGAIFQLAPPAHKGDPWIETVIYRFQGKGENDGESPNGGLVIDGEGNLYGVTAYGGTGDCVLIGVPAGCGTVYKLSPPKQKGGAWNETILYSFRTANRGYLPNGNLVFDRAGNLYGATTFGGGKGATCDKYYGGNCGAVFELSPPKTKGGKWKEKVLHACAGGADGANPNGSLVLDSSDAVYGTTYSGGNQNCRYEGEIGCGTAFRLGPPAKKGGAWTERVLHRFDRTNSDGGNPMAGLVLGAGRELYGTTLNGGPEGGGIAFRLAPSSMNSGPWTETILNAFGNNIFGYDLEAPVVLDRSGNLYGTANTGDGRAAYGDVFRLKPSSRKGQRWILSVLYDFGGVPDGGNPATGLTLDEAGDLYGTTQHGGNGTGCGSSGCGTVFEATP
jgi:hypothetical protein